jgi:hypothetical protein
MYALIRAKVHLGAAVEDVANVRHGDAPFVHPPVGVGSRSNVHSIMIQGRDSSKGALSRWGCYSPRCLILCAVLTLMCSRARGEMAESTLCEGMAEEQRRREEAEQEHDDLRRELYALRDLREPPQTVEEEAERADPGRLR